MPGAHTPVQQRLKSEAKARQRRREPPPRRTPTRSDGGVEAHRKLVLTFRLKKREEHKEKAKVANTAADTLARLLSDRKSKVLNYLVMNKPPLA